MIYSQEADNSDKRNGHSSASSRIVEDFAKKLNLKCAEIKKLPNEQVQTVARVLFEESKRD